MFDKYVICENDFKNVEEAGETVGFQFHARLPYYRGLGISMVENLGVTVNAEKFPRQALRVTLQLRMYEPYTTYRTLRDKVNFDAATGRIRAPAEEE